MSTPSDVRTLLDHLILSSPASGEELFDACTIPIEPDHHFTIAHQRRRRAAVPLIHQFVEGRLVRFDVLGNVLNALVPKKLLGCRAVGSAGFMEQNYHPS